MLLAFLAAALAGQFPSAQSAAAPPPGPSQTYLLLSQAPPAVPVAPSVLITSPPVWDRAMAGVGQWLTARAARHSHPRAAQLLVVTPTTFATPTAQTAFATPSAQAAEATVGPPPFIPLATPIVIPVDQARIDEIRRRFGR